MDALLAPIEGATHQELGGITTLLLRWKPCRWEEPRSPIKSAMQWRRTHGLPPCAERVVKTATLWGGRCSCDTSPLSRSAGPSVTGNT